MTIVLGANAEHAARGVLKACGAYIRAGHGLVPSGEVGIRRNSCLLGRGIDVRCTFMYVREAHTQRPSNEFWRCHSSFVSQGQQNSDERGCETWATTFLMRSTRGYYKP